MVRTFLLSLMAAGVMASSGAVAQSEDENLGPAAILQAAPESVWMTLDPDNILVVDLPSGEMLIEMRPDLAPLHVERIRELVRAGFYDGTIFHRVIEGFMAQGGDPTGTGRGGSELPDLLPEFGRDADTVPELAVIGRDDRAAQIGFLGSVPIGTQAPTLRSVLSRETHAAWGLHCQGTLSMARAGPPNSANSQFFIMFGDSRDTLDQGYTVWGQVLVGYRHARRINRGEPPVRPTPLVRARIMSDLPEEEQRRIEILSPATETFTDYLRSYGALREDGYVPDVCAINVPYRINGELPI